MRNPLNDIQNKCSDCKVQPTASDCPICKKGVCVYCAREHECPGKPRSKGEIKKQVKDLKAKLSITIAALEKASMQEFKGGEPTETAWDCAHALSRITNYK